MVLQSLLMKVTVRMAADWWLNVKRKLMKMLMMLEVCA